MTTFSGTMRSIMPIEAGAIGIPLEAIKIRVEEMVE